MSLGLDSPAATAPEPPADELPAPAATRRGLGLGLWARVGLAVALLAASAAGRAWQARRVDQMLRDGRVSPFRVTELPKVLGPWVGNDERHGPDHRPRHRQHRPDPELYQNTITGQKVALIFLFGPSTEMFVHSPETCYPAAGYERIGGPVPRRSRTPAARPWPFHEMVFPRARGAVPSSRRSTTPGATTAGGPPAW